MANPRSAFHRANRLLAALDRKDLRHLEPYLEVEDLPRGKILYDAGDAMKFIYFPHDCIISLLSYLGNGASVEMAMYGREAALDPISELIGGQSFGRYVVYVPGTASRIDVHRFQEAVEARPNIRQLIRTFMAAHATETFQTIACNAVHPIASRCCRWLLNVHDRLDQDTLPLTHELLANVLGVQRSTLTEILGTLQAAGCIAQGRGTIAITNRAGLEQRACECYWKVRETFEGKLPLTYSAVPI